MEVYYGNTELNSCYVERRPVHWNENSVIRDNEFEGKNLAALVIFRILLTSNLKIVSKRRRRK